MIGAPPKVFKAKQRLGKYRIEGKLAESHLTTVYRALDTIEGVRVALKVPHQHLVSKRMLDSFRQEVRLGARLDHANILPLKNAEIIDGCFVMVSHLGEQTLADRLVCRMSLATALDYAEQMLAALAYAHAQHIIHCDVKPENFILFSGGRLRLADFGIAKVALHTIRASGSGTVGYAAPEQAMGRPSFRSDVFSLSLVLYRMFSGRLPEWPFDWPPPAIDKVRRRLHADFIDVLRRGMEVDPRKRFADAREMLAAYDNIPQPLLAALHAARGPTASASRTMRHKQFLKQFGALLKTHYRCARCEGPVCESMQACPWCGEDRHVHVGGTRFPAHCPRCQRGMKLDWAYCPWCYGPGFEPLSRRQFNDLEYRGRCSNAACSRKVLMPFMRYCAWCHRKVRRKWSIPGSNSRCGSCGWGVLPDYWSFCPWCAKILPRRERG